MKAKKLQLEFNDRFKKGNDTFSVGNNVVMFTPAIDEDYWMFRVKLSKTQSILGFPKFSSIGIGFAKETDWNTNLPSNCEAKEIFEHIKHNKGNKKITDEECIEAIEMIREAANKYKKA